ncbi:MULTISPECIES: flagellar protein FlaG [unclassified Bacillus (in: firmicutes)]|uniref:flagellar protein FlaG n=1 Tax=unclassified Bacillus (in: firmicutes) TaxID=185979 RepID=UPI0008EC158A|nr:MULTISPECIES: flagellar protein FlaG [unclassified Bacillus (in: firmicutes)]SFB21588.1 flagellar protein FlaG [Bacillus sp. UNCCL13]SFQ90993.1 flagellar protein FlaG [Bacillus sp. cl95]
MIERVSTGHFPSPQRTSNQIENTTGGQEIKIGEVPIELMKERDITFPKAKIEEVVQGMNKFLEPTHTSLKFQFHEKLNEYYVTIVDDKTEEIVREIPPKKLLDMYAAMTEFVGLFVDKKI